MKLKVTLPTLRTARLWKLAWIFFLLVWAGVCEGQQIFWTKLFALPNTDLIRCLTKDAEGNLYAAGSTRRYFQNPTPDIFQRGFLMKLDENGDTIFTRYFEAGTIYSLAVDAFGTVRINILQESLQSAFNNLLVSQQMTPEGFIFKRDTINFPLGMYPYSSMVGKDSSLVIVGTKPRLGIPSQQSMFFLRLAKDGLIYPWIELNPGHPNCVANRVEQLPNGNYLVSGYVVSRIASYELNEDGSNPVFKQWYQTPDLSNLTAGHVGQMGDKSWMIGAQGNPALLGVYDSLSNKVWLRKENAIVLPPQAMTDQSMVFGFYSGIALYQALYRIRKDSSFIWNIAFKDSLEARSLLGYADIKSFAFFDDESAVLAGTYRWDGAGTTNTKEDPIFLRISNVGTPVTSLSKPKRGTLSNETLAPCPNPSGGTLYLKQHFDKAEVHFFTVSGREVQTNTIRFGQPIDISSFAPGLYLYRAVIDGKPYSGKIIKHL